MNSYLINNAPQNQRPMHPNYRPGKITNPIQAPLNNSNQTISQYIYPQSTSTNSIQSRYNPANIIPSQINPIYQQQNIRVSLPISNTNLNQAQNLFKNIPNIFNKKSQMINENLSNKAHNQIPMYNNNIPYTPGINSSQNLIQGKSYQAIKAQENNKNINQANSAKNLNKNNQNKINQASNGHPPISMKLANEAMKSICKISYLYNNKTTFGTGFFLKHSDSLKLLISNYHVIFPQLMNYRIEIEIWNNKKMILNLKGRYIKFLEEPKDITAVEIKITDEIYKDIQFLNYDLNYNQYGYNIYSNAFIFSIEHPLGRDAAAASGKIIDICKFQFDHDIDTDKGSSGSPIILLNLNINLVMVIGIHKNTDSNDVNGGTFIGEIIDEINNELNLRKSKNLIKKIDNYIIGEININDSDVSKKTRIINLYEEKIKECEIEINNKLISFNYFYEFKKKGKYKIKYNFQNYLTNTNYMFYECKCLINLDLSNFKSQNINNMECMFSYCESLKELNLSNFNTQKVTNMSNLFSHCKSITSLNLNNFNTQNVYNMSNIFSYCESLSYLNILNFNTKNVINMEAMFYNCKSLAYLNLSNLNTENVTNMSYMFYCCKSLTYLNISSFDTKKVTNMNHMFSYCELLTNLNFQNFNTQNVTNAFGMFSGCESLFSVKDSLKQNTDLYQLILEEDGIFEYEPKIKGECLKKRINFMTVTQRKTKILIDPNKSMNVLIIFYFEVIKRPELYGDSSIRFLMYGNLIPHNSKNLIKKYINPKNDINTIVVDDLDDKLKII